MGVTVKQQCIKFLTTVADAIAFCRGHRTHFWCDRITWKNCVTNRWECDHFTHASQQRHLFDTQAQPEESTTL